MAINIVLPKNVIRTGSKIISSGRMLSPVRIKKTEIKSRFLSSRRLENISLNKKILPVQVLTGVRVTVRLLS